MTEKHPDMFIRTTVYLPIRLHESAKIMAILTKTNVSRLVSIALREKLDKLKGQSNKGIEQ